MSSVNAFVISDEDDEITVARAHEVGLGLDRIDFSINGYHVNEVIFPRVSGAAAKGKAAAVEEVEEGEEDDVPSRIGSPGPITLDSDSDEEEPPMEFPSQSTSGAGGSSSPPVLQLTYPKAGPSPLAARPHSAPAAPPASGRGRPAAKRRKVASVDPSPLGRGAAEENARLSRLEQQLAESERMRLEMEQRLLEREAAAKLRQDQQDAAATAAAETARKNHEELLQMFRMAVLGNSSGAMPAALVVGSTSLAQPAVQIEVQPQLQALAAPADTVMRETSPTARASPHREVPLPSRSPSPPPSPPPQPPLEEDFDGHSPGSPRT